MIATLVTGRMVEALRAASAARGHPRNLLFMSEAGGSDPGDGDAADLRVDALSGRRVIVAAGRAARPHTVAPDPPEDAGRIAECPFCAGNEAKTPPELARTGAGDPGTPGWRVRVFPNLYPIVGAGSSAGGPHEVVTLSPDHTRAFGRLDPAAAVEVFTVLRDRVAAQLADGRAYAVAFINHRRAAGASIAHPHAQVVGLDFVPPEVIAAQHRAATADADLLAADLDLAKAHDTVLVDGAASSWLPYAAGTSFTVRVAHESAGARFDLASHTELHAVATTLHDAMTRLDVLLDDPPYNIVAHTAAADGTGPRRWYVEVMPRTSVIAGFELATGLLVNAVPPEQAAPMLRGATR